MKLLAWIGVAVTIFGLLLGYMAYMPIFERFNETMTDRTNYTGRAATTFNRLNNTTETILRGFLYVFTLILIIYGYATMQSRERITGAYR